MKSGQNGCSSTDQYMQKSLIHVPLSAMKLNRAVDFWSFRGFDSRNANDQRGHRLQANGSRRLQPGFRFFLLNFRLLFLRPQHEVDAVIILYTAIR